MCQEYYRGGGLSVCLCLYVCAMVYVVRRIKPERVNLFFISWLLGNSETGKSDPEEATLEFASAPSGQGG